MNRKEDKRIKEAAALQYTPGKDTAPKIIALGKGEAAEKILETAKKNDIPMHEDAELVHTLNQLDIGAEIPPELYEVVAEILVFVSKLDKKFGEKNG